MTSSRDAQKVFTSATANLKNIMTYWLLLPCVMMNRCAGRKSERSTNSMINCFWLIKVQLYCEQMNENKCVEKLIY